MPFFFNFKALFGFFLVIAILLGMIFFFAFFAIIIFPLILIIYLFRKRILKYFFIKSFSQKYYSQENQNVYNNFSENSNQDFIEVEYEKDVENDKKN
ncbi:hypothetical protein OA264_00225 [Alphaproteobacteria bacterium]|nr:hypothetical protein [Alphaproteobacteria bacterium]